MEKDDIARYLHQLSDALGRMQVRGELCLYGGAVMCLVYEARPSTKDVDAVFRPVQEMRDAAKKVAEANGLREDWLNDAVKGFVVQHSQRILFDMPHLKVYVPEPDYLLAMKVLAARVEGTDRQDVEHLIKIMGLTRAQEVFAILEAYYPNEQIRPATQFFIEEIFERP